MDFNAKDIGRRIKLLRITENKHQKDVSEYLGISLSAYSKIERGDRGVSPEKCIALANYFGVSCDYILRGANAQSDKKDGFTMDFNQYQELARRTQNPKLTQHERLMHALHGMASEVGEIHGIYQKTYQGHMLDVEKVIDEMGDLCWFIAELADVLAIPLNGVPKHNITKLAKRYPEGFSEYNSINREEYKHE